MPTDDLRRFIGRALLALFTVTFAAACQRTAQSPDLQATVNAAVETALASATAPTPTAAPSPLPTATSTPVPWSGWERHGNDELGFHLSVPPGWVVLELDEETRKGLSNVALETVPELRIIASQAREIMTDGMRFIAIDPDLTFGSESSTNVNVLTEDVQLHMSLKNYLLLSAAYVEQTFEVKPIWREINLSSGRAGYFEWNREENLMIQYVFIADQTVWIVTCTTLTEYRDHYGQICEWIASSASFS